MTILLVRHALAGERALWHEDDRVRPVSEIGTAQSSALIGHLAPYRFDRIISSPFTRCIQTVEPIAHVRGMKVETSEVLGEDIDRAAIATLLDGLVGRDVLLCSHGDLIQDALRLLGSRHVDLGTDLRYQKASTWMLDDDGAAIVRGRYLPPPLG